ncbi:hypothetical protein [uncultured Aliiroseovarius sp.]|uniref:CAP domain-containing protein n=1 Tax=uncultured Aliiroseovarius sp. TaxID=1658783 RepID=UPI002603046E|nr:hypothetical protein [uncultured Aliiroseovarius sp.]
MKQLLLSAALGLFALQSPALAGDPILVSSKAGSFNYYKPTPNDHLSDIEKQAYDILMRERKRHGLSTIPLSSSLTLVAGRHVEDFTRNIAPRGGPIPGTNTHSWSDRPYYSNHRAPKAMWDAPKRLRTRYRKNGYEITAWGYSDPEVVIRGFLNSPNHRKVILNEGMWRRKTWRSVGIGFGRAKVQGQYRTFWSIWFGDAKDPAGKPQRN